MKKNKCQHNHLKVRKHRKDPYPCLHCLEGCKATWSDPIRCLSFLRTFKYLKGIEKENEK